MAAPRDLVDIPRTPCLRSRRRGRCFRGLISAIAVLACLAIAPAAHAVRVRPSLGDLVSEAAYILIGDVVDVRSSLDANGTTITSVVTLIIPSDINDAPVDVFPGPEDVDFNQDRLVDDGNIKNSVGSSVAVTTLGGVVGDVSSEVEDEAEFEPGERALIFLVPVSPYIGPQGSALFVAHGLHGKYTIVGDQVPQLNLSLGEFVARIKLLLQAP